ncbi:MAG: hypothetical protein R3E87_25625 [Burkholderiaceae bacterium]
MNHPTLAVELADFGSFHAGGRAYRIAGEPVARLQIAPGLQLDHDPNGNYQIESCYVQYWIPRRVSGEPILLIHGGGLSGVCWETTPDGRPGWVQRLVAAGRPVYVADMMERGRAGWCALPDVWDGPAIMRTTYEAWWLFRFGPATDFPLRRAFDGQRFPVDALDAFMKQAVPRWLNNTDAAIAAFSAAIERIGPCTVITHSSGGVYGYRLAFDQPGLVRDVISLEPSTFPGEVPASLVGQRFLHVMGAYLDEVPWSDLDRRTREWAARLERAGALTEHRSLEDDGLPGHSHMFMMGHGNEHVLERVLAWLNERS